MLDYSKTILEKVSFDQQLFKKELEKASKDLNSVELTSLKEWCFTMFGNRYKKLLSDHFNKVESLAA